MIKKILWLLLVPALALLLVLLLRPGSDEPEQGVSEDPMDEQALSQAIGQRRGALVDEVVFTQQSDVGKVTGLIEQGAYQLFTQGITNASVFHRLRTSEKGDYETAYGASSELALNPAEFETGFNPFSVQAIREAMNWLIDRRHVAEEIYGGLAVPRVLPINTAFPDYARLAATARALELEYRHDPERARRVIHEQMRAHGAELRDGRWFHEGEPVPVRVLIRTEDARNQVGDYVANLMEDLGFTVHRQYRTAEEASRIWIAGDPAAGQWHIYTGAWVSTTINRDESGSLSFYYTKRGRPELLWQAYEPGEELDTIAARLERRDFDTMEERRELMGRGLELAMESSYHIWLVDQQSIIPRASNVVLASDLAGGIAGSRLWPYTLRYRDRVGGRMVVGAPSLLTEPWNPVAGSNWLYDTMIMRSLNDPALLPDPFTGLYRPQGIDSAEVTVQEGLPVQKSHDWLSLERAESIAVPEEAWIGWNAEEGRLVTVEEAHPDGVTARSKTRIRYEEGFLDRRWHDGTPMSLADLVLPWILTMARGDENSPYFDPSHAPRLEVFKQYFRGWRIVSREPLVLDVYSNQVLPDAETIVANQAFSPQAWHSLAIAMRAERNGELAFSSHKADSNRVEWMSLVSGPSLGILRRHLDEALEQGFLPYRDVLGDFVRDGNEIRQRYQALQAWEERYNHFWVGDGPFYLHAVHPVERTVVLRRYEGFPDPSGKWLDFTQPEIPALTLDGPLMVRQGGSARFSLDIRFNGEPYPTEAIESVKYLLFDGDGRQFSRGAMETGDQESGDQDGNWQLRLSPDELEALGNGANSLEVAVISSRVALPSFASHAFATVPSGTKTLEERDEEQDKEPGHE
ncbi:MAG: ABC transporter substrate-binding protein [Oleiphilaceae bacterium]|nr:ABC transporter substrate-binding protein [Oleiphilaceae bacterium]